MLDVQVKLDAQAGKQVDNADCHRKDEQLHRVVEGQEPERRNADLMPEEGAGNDVDHVAEITAEHDAPCSGRDTAEEEHLDHLAQARFDIFELEQDQTGADAEQRAIAEVREHQAEEEIIKAGHDRRRVDLAAQRQPVRLEHPFDRLREPVVAQCAGDFLFLTRIFQLDREVKPAGERGFERGSVRLGDIARQQEGAARLGEAADRLIPFGTHRIIIGEEEQGFPRFGL